MYIKLMLVLNVISFSIATTLQDWVWIGISIFGIVASVATLILEAPEHKTVIS
ncbi:hypothetical protein [Pseudomonas syringae]|uniref:hypothetical protein n=1 Tax=Pseudomonas syringae TaxID=317 RepID=UPI0013793275|nr:hypothetical protein [Pseudomonas syringae]MDU8540227.1 hypothetical protein [Pseudomonas syringae pv. actinidiae]